MYYPIQIPYILNQEFAKGINYRELPLPEFEGLAICLWEMLPSEKTSKSMKNIIIADACIDIIVDFEKEQIGFSGMSQTDFDFKVVDSGKSFGIRLLPGVFHQLTGLSAMVAMDNFLEFSAVFLEFDQTALFKLDFPVAQQVLRKFIKEQLQARESDKFVAFFNELWINPPVNTAELYQRSQFSPRQCQRLFKKSFGLTPKMLLSIIRFQKCLIALTKSKQTPAEILKITNFYDQAHFINDFKRNIGITPQQLLSIYQTTQ
ncbi:AraC-like DNA-binding protein [Enterococcus sp. PF1-24]|uniref:helix-turn-helix domain-containing protein n=1 Tax=unclassified Enterococcus TaxID=2608891 RepID=UPI002476EE85|nr:MULTISPECIES: AraC family transcriptional regulator [unclassified Enterococcus]MDH6365005.1 AraC-like DNA-binding protein [Enterococcus sp. PFB1-1]MDH6402106.1 AraC-like DNA-binding protein [Enterococcus sp. PF1-24]